jgi:hypothetical protein
MQALLKEWNHVSFVVGVAPGLCQRQLSHLERTCGEGTYRKCTVLDRLTIVDLMRADGCLSPGSIVSSALLEQERTRAHLCPPPPNV